MMVDTREKGGDLSRTYGVCMGCDGTGSRKPKGGRGRISVRRATLATNATIEISQLGQHVHDAVAKFMASLALGTK
jgi:hypothetical protein